MAIGNKSDFIIYHDEFFGGMVEILQQNAEAFNEASSGAIRLVTMAHRGDYEKESFFKSIAALVSRRDPTSTSGVTDTALTQGERVGVKLNRRIGPVSDTLDAFRKIAEDPSEFSFLLGQQIGPAVAIEYLNSSLTALSAAIGAVAALNYDHTAVGSGTLSHTALVRGLSKFGDRASRVIAWVMHSKPYFDLIENAIADKIFEEAGLVVYGGQPGTLGKPVIVTDDAALTNTTPDPDEYYILGLVEGAAEASESEQREIVTDTITGEENLRYRIQGEYAFNLKLKGYTWDVTNGGANPNAAALGTGSNWDKVASDNKLTAGIRIKVK